MQTQSTDVLVVEVISLAQHNPQDPSKWEHPPNCTLQMNTHHIISYRKAIPEPTEEPLNNQLVQKSCEHWEVLLKKRVLGTQIHKTTFS